MPIAECHKQAHYAECRYAECHYAECHYAECRGALDRPCSGLLQSDQLEICLFLVEMAFESLFKCHF
jgi:hypothetical protein